MIRVLTLLLIIVAVPAAIVWAQSDPVDLTPFATPQAAEGDSAAQIGPPPAIVTAIIFKSACGRCHGSDRPAIGLSLRAENFAAAMIDVPSKEIPTLKLVDTKDPENSYLLMKLRGDEGTIGERMPLGGEPLSEEAIASIEAWVSEVSAAAAADTAAAADPEATEAPEAEKKTESPAVPEDEGEAEPPVGGAN